MKKNKTSFTTNGRLEDQAKRLQEILGSDSNNAYLKLSETDFARCLNEADSIELKKMCESFNVSSSGVKESVKERLAGRYSKEKNATLKGQIYGESSSPINRDPKKYKDIQKALNNL
jgi:hypothetical protein